MTGLSGCTLGTVIGVVVDAGIEVVKLPFKIGGAVIDIVSDDEDEARDDVSEEQQDDV